MSLDNSVEHVLARLEEFFAIRTPWHRSLWTVGTVLGLREVAEYADSCVSGSVGSTEGLKFVVASSKREVQRDPGVRALNVELSRLLEELNVASTSKVRQHSIEELRQLTRRAEAEYCASWASESAAVSLEFRSRALASHLLDSGFSSSHLHRWLTAIRPQISTISDLGEAVESMFGSMAEREFQVFIPCAAPFAKASGSTASIRWIDGSQGREWLQANVPERESRRHNGGFLLEIRAKDPWAAVEAARSYVGRMNARVKVATPSNEAIVLDGWARVAGSKQKFDARQAARQIEIGSLERMDAVYDFEGGLSTSVDDALELASYMEESPSAGAAITGGWSAIESLLIRPGEGSHYLGADRMAALICCSLPRAELTALAYQHAEGCEDTLATEIVAAETNHAKVLLVEKHLANGGRLSLEAVGDVAAEARMISMIKSPDEDLGRAREYVTESLRRLYNQRNMISHAGMFRSVALHSTIRTALSLVAAGLDRIVHAELETDGVVPPLALLARAETELKLLGTTGARNLASLLD